jgi:hypothetical protein
MMLQRHLQETYEYLFEAAHHALMDGGSFAPFGAGTRKTGELIHTNVGLDMDKSVPADHISGLIAGFRKEEEDHGLIAAGLVFDGRASSDDAAALCFHIEAANGAALEIILPYQRAPANVIQFYEPKISPVQPEIFTEVM